MKNRRANEKIDGQTDDDRNYDYNTLLCRGVKTSCSKILLEHAEKEQENIDFIKGVKTGLL